MKLIILVTLTVFLIGCEAKPKKYSYQVPPQLSDGWEVSSLQDQGMDPIMMTDMTQKIMDHQYTGINSVVLVRNGFLVLDEYFENGELDEIHTTRSASKSITSALVGIAIDKKYIPSADAKLFAYFPEYQGLIKNWDDRKDSITLSHVLSMSSGIKGNEDAMYPESDWIKFYLDQPMFTDPGKAFSYATSGVVTLGSVISRTSGMSVPDFTNKYLFEPLQIKEYFWPKTNSKGNQGLAMTGGGLKLKSRDMAKFGQLYLDKGVWKGQRIISEDWINHSIKKHATSNLYGEDFSYLWRMIDREVDGQTIRSYEAWGNGGQFIMVFPSLDLVAVFTGENFGKFPEMEQPFELIDQFIIPAVE